VTYLTTHSVLHGVGHDIWLEGLWEGMIKFVFDSLYPGRVSNMGPPWFEAGLLCTWQLSVSFSSGV